MDDVTQLIIQRLDRQDEVLGEIHHQAKLTNGRVTELERYRIRQEAVDEERAARDRERRTILLGPVAALFVAVLGSAVGAVLTVLAANWM